MLLAKISAPGWYQHVTFGVAVLGAGLGLYNAWIARRVRVAVKRKESPYYKDAELLTRGINGSFADGSHSYGWYLSEPRQIADRHTEGELLKFRAYNRGGEARFCEIKLLTPLAGAEVGSASIGDSQGVVLTYPYTTSHQGQVIRFPGPTHQKQAGLDRAGKMAAWTKPLQAIWSSC